MRRSSYALRQVARTPDSLLLTQASQALELEQRVAIPIVSPDDVPLEIEDLAPHFLFEATQSALPRSSLATVPMRGQGADAALREDFFEGADDRARLREFERTWKHILARERRSQSTQRRSSG